VSRPRHLLDGALGVKKKQQRDLCVRRPRLGVGVEASCASVGVATRAGRSAAWRMEGAARRPQWHKDGGSYGVRSGTVWGYKPLYPHGPTWAAPSEVARPMR
jgi:hypothetical protein